MENDERINRGEAEIHEIDMLLEVTKQMKDTRFVHLVKHQLGQFKFIKTL